MNKYIIYELEQLEKITGYSLTHIKNDINDVYNKLEEKGKEIERLNNIINELEKWLESEIDRIIRLKNPKRRSIPPYGEENYYYENMILRYKEVLDKLKELRGSDK